MLISGVLNVISKYGDSVKEEFGLKNWVQRRKQY